MPKVLNAERRNFAGMLFKTPHNASLGGGLESLSNKTWHVAVARARLTNGKWSCQCQCGYSFTITAQQLQDDLQSRPANPGNVKDTDCCGQPLPFVSFSFAEEFIGEDHHIRHTYWHAGCCSFSHDVVDEWWDSADGWENS